MTYLYFHDTSLSCHVIIVSRRFGILVSTVGYDGTSQQYKSCQNGYFNDIAVACLVIELLWAVIYDRSFSVWADSLYGTYTTSTAFVSCSLTTFRSSAYISWLNYAVGLK